MMRTKEVTAGDVTFVISKMPLIQGDRWANRVALALCRGGVDVSGFLGGSADLSDIKGMIDIVGITNTALKALGGIDDDEAQALLDELLNYIKVQLSDGSTRSIVLESDVKDIQTLWKLRIEAIKINLDFLMAGVTQQ